MLRWMDCNRRYDKVRNAPIQPIPKVLVSSPTGKKNEKLTNKISPLQ